MTDSKAAATVEDALLEIYSNEAADEFSTIKNICISDAAVGNVIFQRVYKWKDSSAFSNLGSLIQVFYQFAREVDDGVISSINFESGDKSRRKKNDFLNMKDNQTMQMVSVKTKDIIVSVFYDMSGSLVPSTLEKLKLDVLMHSLKTAFERKYLSELMENRTKSNNDSVHESQSQQLQSGMSVEEMALHQIVNIEDSLRIGSMSSTSIDLEFRP
eukprot:gene27101-35818_t